MIPPALMTFVARGLSAGVSARQRPRPPTALHDCYGRATCGNRLGDNAAIRFERPTTYILNDKANTESFAKSDIYRDARWEPRTTFPCFRQRHPLSEPIGCSR